MQGISGVGTTKRALLQELLTRFEAFMCPGCHEVLPPDRLTKHHILPRSEGGPTALENLVLLCRDCHTSLHKGHGETIRAVRKFVRPRGRHFAFPPPPEPMPAEEGIRLFLTRMSVLPARVANSRRFARNPPFDPMWPIGRHFSPPADDGLVRFPVFGA
jgi:hypothetical protein